MDLEKGSMMPYRPAEENEKNITRTSLVIAAVVLMGALFNIGTIFMVEPYGKPAQEVHRIQVCDKDTMKIVVINGDDFNATVFSKDLEDCRPE